MNKAEEFLSNLSEKEREGFLDEIKRVYDSYLSEEKDKLQSVLTKKSDIETEYEQIWSVEREMTYGDEKSKLMDKRMAIRKDIAIIEKDIVIQSNKVDCLSNFGKIVEIQDQKGNVYPSVCDYRSISTDSIMFDEENILTTPKPPYIPLINEKKFAAKSYKFDSIRLTKDTYLMAIEEFKADYSVSDFGSEYVLLTLDQLVLCTEYYFSKAKAEAKAYAEKRNEEIAERYFKMSEESRRKYMFHPNIYNSIPASEKKKITKEDFEKLSLEDREKIYIPVQKVGAKRIKREVELDTMPRSFHKMYEYFVDPSVYVRDSSGNKSDRGKYGDPRVFEYWRAFVDMMQYKIKDIQIQRIDQSETYKKAFETSFGESNTNGALKSEYGIMVKRQNGEPINPIDIEQIRQSFSSIQAVFGNLKDVSDKYALKISHSGNKLMFAMKALGAFIPSINTIGVSNKYGDLEFRSTMAHEIGHFIDYFVGQTTGKRYASDDFEATAGIIAFTFRNKMNKPKDLMSDYINSTKECFARAMQEYYLLKVYGDDAVVNYSSTIIEHSMPVYNIDHNVSKSVFEESLVPLIEKFLEENKDVFGTLEPIITESEPETSIAELIESLELLLPDEEIEVVIEGLKLLI